MNSAFSKLADINRANLRVVEEAVYPKSDFFNGETSPLAVGTIIVRPAKIFNTGRAEFVDIEFAEATKGEKISFVFKGRQSQLYFTKAWTVRESTKKGIICFCEVEVPNDWIAFEVTKVGNKGTSAIVKPITGTIESLLEKYYETPTPVEHSGVVKQQ